MNKKETKRVVVIIGPGFEDEEVIYPVIRLREAGLEVDIATKDAGVVASRKGCPLETLIKYFANLVDATKLEDVYDLVMIPGGFEGPDRVRQIPEVLDFLREVDKKGKIIVAFCHGPWVLVSAGLLKEKRATCYQGIIDDVKNAGAHYLDQAVVEDGNIITARHPKDMPELMKTILERVQ
ncbi:MAG: type 1 glutamine amidotransferase domain-containing protein [Patescibacteria group bacterium]